MNLNYSKEIRAQIAENHLHNYEVAEAMSISNSLFYQRLQRSMNEAQAQEFFRAIKKLSEGRKVKSEE